MKERRERLELFLEARRRKRGRSWSPSCIDNSFFVASFPSIPFFIFLTLLHSLACSLSLSSTYPFCHLSAFSYLSLTEVSLRVRSAAPSWVATDTAVPGSTTRTNIKPETAIRRPEYGSSPRTSPYAGDACVAFKPTPKPTPYLTRGYLAPVLQFSESLPRLSLSPLSRNSAINNLC